MKNVFDSYFPNLEDLTDVITSFDNGYVEVSDKMPSKMYLDGIKEIKGLGNCIKRLKIEQTPSQIASASEFILEGLHLNNKLNKEQLKDKIVYK